MSASDIPAQPANPTRNVSRKLLILIVLVALADLLLFGREPGLNLFLFVNAIAAGVLLCSRKPQSLPKATGLPALAFVLSAPLLETTSWMGIALSLLGITCVSLAATGLFPRRLVRLPVVLFRFLLDLPLRPFRRATYGRLRHSRRPTPETIWHHLRGWIMPLSFTAGFVALFAMANPLIDKVLRSFDLAYFLQFLDAWRIGFWLIVAAFVSVLLRPRLKRLARRRPDQASDAVKPESAFFGHAALLRSLFVFNALFAIQSLLDLTYLWGGVNLPDGMSHAEYAHRGAYPLMVTALLAAAFVLAAMRRDGPGNRSALVRGLVHLWIAQNILLCFSSILRLDLYVESYSLTELRVAAGIWMGLVAMGLFLILLRILLQRSNEWLVALSLATLVVTLYAIALVDIPAFIARFNVAHSSEVAGEGMPLDIDYLSTLGPSAIPALDTYLASLPAEAERAAPASKVRSALVVDEWQRSRDWRSWTFRAARLDRYLRDHTTLAR